MTTSGRSTQLRSHGRPINRSRFVLIFLVIGAIPLLGLPWFTVSMMSANVAAQVSTQAAGVAGSVTLYADQLVLGRVQTARIAGQRSDVLNAMLGSSDTGAALDNIAAVLPEQTAVALAGADGTVVAASDAGFLAPGGQLPASWSAGVVATGTANATTARGSDGSSQLVVVAPITDSGGTAKGMLVIESGLSGFRATVNQYAVSQALSLTVRDATGTSIAQAGGTPQSLPAAALPAVTPAVGAGEVEHLDLPGGGATVAAQRSDVLRWTVVTAIPDSVAYAPVDAMRRTVLLLAAGLAALFLAGSGVMELALRSQERAHLSLKVSNMRLQDAATHDSLTNLANRSLFTERLREMAALHGSGVVLLLDMNRFKEVNDTLGHAAGDALLTEVARRLEGAVREGDTVARLGGDEFGVILPGADELVAGQVVDRMHREVTRTLVIKGTSLHPSVSIGHALLAPGEAPDQLLRRADEAMYALKVSRAQRESTGR